jgi:hypothetical protein
VARNDKADEPTFGRGSPDGLTLCGGFAGALAQRPERKHEG